MPTLLKDPRAYLAGLSTTASLALGACILLITVTSLAAFSGWSPAQGADALGDLVLDDPLTSDARAGLSPGVAAAKAARAAATAASEPRSRAAAGDRAFVGESPSRTSPGASPRLDDGRPVSRDRGSEPVRRANPTSPPAAAPAPAGSAPGLQGATDELGQTAEDLTGRLGGAVDQVSPQVGEMVSGTGKALGDAVRGVGAPH